MLELRSSYESGTFMHSRYELRLKIKSFRVFKEENELSYKFIHLDKEKFISRIRVFE